jgi:hypothetical protein
LVAPHSRRQKKVIVEIEMPVEELQFFDLIGVFISVQIQIA